MKIEQKPEVAIYAGGCFWGVEYFFQQAIGVLSTRCGYTGGTKENPTYQEVKTGTTGHAEAVEVVYDANQTTYAELTRVFFEIHDPTQLNYQGVDHGTQYRSVIFYTNEEQKKVAEMLIEKLKSFGYKVVTQVVPAGKFWPAEDYHQKYLEKKKEIPECHFYCKRFKDAHPDETYKPE